MANHWWFYYKHRHIPVIRYESSVSLQTIRRLMNSMILEMSISHNYIYPKHFIKTPWTSHQRARYIVFGLSLEVWTLINTLSWCGVISRSRYMLVILQYDWVLSARTIYVSYFISKTCVHRILAIFIINSNISYLQCMRYLVSNRLQAINNLLNRMIMKTMLNLLHKIPIA